MGYLFLGIALLSGAIKGYCGKKTSGYANGFCDAVLANIIRMILCIMIGFLCLLLTENPCDLFPASDMLLISLLSGISTAIFVVTWLLSVRQNAYMMLEVFLMLGMLVPLIASNFIFGETIRVTQWIGIIILFVATVIMCSYNNATKGKLNLSSTLLLLICGLSNGIADFSQKLFTKQLPNGSAAAFNLYTYLFAAVTLILIFAFVHKRSTEVNCQSVKKIFGFVFVMAVCLFANSFFKTLAAAHLDAVILYPLNQGFALVLSALMATVFFHEKLTIKAVIGIATAFVGLLIINLV